MIYRPFAMTQFYCTAYIEQHCSWWQWLINWLTKKFLKSSALGRHFQSSRLKALLFPLAGNCGQRYRSLNCMFSYKSTSVFPPKISFFATEPIKIFLHTDLQSCTRMLSYTELQQDGWGGWTNSKKIDIGAYICRNIEIRWID